MLHLFSKIGSETVMCKAVAELFFIQTDIFMQHISLFTDNKCDYRNNLLNEIYMNYGKRTITFDIDNF